MTTTVQPPSHPAALKQTAVTHGRSPPSLTTPHPTPPSPHPTSPPLTSPQTAVTHGRSLELPPRLLRLARRTQSRRPGGIGLLGLKKRLSSRQLAQLVYPLMNAQHAIAEADDDEQHEQADAGASAALPRPAASPAARGRFEPARASARGPRSLSPLPPRAA